MQNITPIIRDVVLDKLHSKKYDKDFHYLDIHFVVGLKKYSIRRILNEDELYIISDLVERNELQEQKPNYEGNFLND